MQKRMAVELEKHEGGLDKDGEAGEVSYSKFQYHSLIQLDHINFEMTQFKMPCGTYNPL